MTPEEKNRLHIWWLLKRIKEEYLATPTNTAVNFNTGNIEYLNHPEIPSIGTRNKLMFKLQEFEIIKILEEDESNQYNGFTTTFKIEILQPTFDEIYKQYQKKLSSKSIPEIFYNKNTGIGYANNKRFKLKNDQPDFRVFEKLYENINNPIPRKQVLELSGYQEQDDGELDSLNKNVKRKTSMHTSATYFINDLVKKIRERTGLTPDHIVNNNGELTLVGIKTEFPPKES